MFIRWALGFHTFQYASFLFLFPPTVFVSTFSDTMTEICVVICFSLRWSRLSFVEIKTRIKMGSCKSGRYTVVYIKLTLECVWFTFFVESRVPEKMVVQGDICQKKLQCRVLVERKGVFRAKRFHISRSSILPYGQVIFCYFQTKLF